MGGVSAAGVAAGAGAESIGSSTIEAAGRAAAVADGVIRSGGLVEVGWGGWSPVRVHPRFCKQTIWR